MTWFKRPVKVRATATITSFGLQKDQVYLAIAQDDSYYLIVTDDCLIKHMEKGLYLRVPEIM